MAENEYREKMKNGENNLQILIQPLSVNYSFNQFSSLAITIMFQCIFVAFKQSNKIYYYAQCLESDAFMQSLNFVESNIQTKSTTIELYLERCE